MSRSSEFTQAPIRQALRNAWVSWKSWAWWLTIPVVAILCFAIRWQLTFNMTPSLDIHLAVIERGNHGFNHGSLVAFGWIGGPPIPNGLEVVKRVVGLPGDQVQPLNGCAATESTPYLYDGCIRISSAQGQELAVLPVKRYRRDGHTPLKRIPFEGRIPAEHYFVMGDHPDSLDSRYANTGLVTTSQTLGKAVWVW